MNEWKIEGRKKWKSENINESQQRFLKFPVRSDINVWMNEQNEWIN